jgi:hypothetical protein
MIAGHNWKLGGNMPSKFALNDAADFDSNLEAFSTVLGKLDAELGAAIAQKLTGNLERSETLNALLAALAYPATKK